MVATPTRIGTNNLESNWPLDRDCPVVATESDIHAATNGNRQ